MENFQELMHFCKLIVGYVQDFYLVTVIMVIKMHENTVVILFIILIGIDHTLYCTGIVQQLGLH